MKTIRTTDNHSATPKRCFTPLKFYFLALLCCLCLADAGAAQVGTAFTYSGRLKYKNNPADGNFDLQLKLYDDPINNNNPVATYSANSLPIVNGLFVMSVDFGSVNMFDGTAYWLELSARPTGNNGAYQTFSPRQPVNPTPYSFFAPLAATANSANAAAVNAVSSSSIQNNAISAPKIASGQVVKSLNGFFDDVILQAGANVTLTPSGNGLSIAASGGGGAGWSLTGNAGTTAGQNFLGTVDLQPLEFHVNGNRGLRLEWATDGSMFPSYAVNVVAGFWGNTNQPGLLGTTVSGGGGGFNFFLGDNTYNAVNANYGTIGGGDACIVNGAYGTVPGGRGNRANGYCSLAAGFANEANGSYSFALGNFAHAAHDGSFVWSDGTGSAYSTGTDRFEVFASGGGVFHTEFLSVSGLGGEQAYLGGDGLGNDIQVGSLNPSVSVVAFYNAGNNTYMDGVVRTLTIVGGSDLAEPFELSDENIPPGSVVIIDDNHPGQLVRSNQPYDTRVAGVVSGANGIHPGLMLHQEGVNGAGKNVALSGRVYVLAEAATGAIKPGDLLTTSATPGRAMKVTDHARAHGAVLGKAMSGLSQGKGMVLVLVTLQ